MHLLPLSAQNANDQSFLCPCLQYIFLVYKYVCTMPIRACTLNMADEIFHSQHLWFGRYYYYYLNSNYLRTFAHSFGGNLAGVAGHHLRPLPSSDLGFYELSPKLKEPVNCVG